VTEMQLLTAYFAERRRTHGRFASDALVDLFARERVPSSITLRGIAGFGTTHVLRGDRRLTLSEDPPVTVTAVDSADRIGALTDDVVALIGHGIVTLERARTMPGSLPELLPEATHVRLSMHLGRKQAVTGTPAYVTACDVLHQCGFVTADVSLGVDGTVQGRRRRARFLSRNADVPVLVTGIGTRPQALRAASEVRAALPDTLTSVRPALLCRIDGDTPAEIPEWPLQKLTVHSYEDTRWRGQPLHRALTAQLRAGGQAGGATALRSLWGFRGSRPPRGDRFLQLTRRVPVTTVLVGPAATIAADRRIVDEVTAEHGIVTCEPVTALVVVNGDRRLDVDGAG
jgi:PII-like signaling protein